MYLENLFGAEKFYQIFFGFFGNFLCLWIFFPIFLLSIFGNFFKLARSDRLHRSSLPNPEHLFSRPNLVLNLFSFLLPQLPSYFDPTELITSFLNSSPSSIPSIFTSITFHSLQILYKPKPPNCSLKP